MIVKYDFKPSDFVKNVKLKPKTKAKLFEDMKDFVLESVLKYVGEGKSPVTGKDFPKLNEKYAEKKKKEGATVIGKLGSNLELSGSMLDDLKVIKKDTYLRLTVTGDENQKKADNHNKFTSKSKNTALKPRKFIPNVNNNETFASDIKKELPLADKDITSSLTISLGKKNKLFSKKIQQEFQDMINGLDDRDITKVFHNIWENIE